MDYTPINCNFYDELEALATLRKRVKIIYTKNNEVHSIYEVITTFFVKDHVEYLTLSNGISIRLDTLIEVDGKLLPGIC